MANIEEHAAAAATAIVTSETEFNDAIARANQGSVDRIDIGANFTLSADATAISRSVAIVSSNGSRIADGGHAVLSISNGAQVSFAVNAGGSGTSRIDNDGNGTKLTVYTGSVLHGLELDGGGLIVPSGERFVVDTLSLDNMAGIELAGILRNTQPVSTNLSMITARGGAQEYLHPGSTNEEAILMAQPAIGDLTVGYETFLKIDPRTTLIAGKINVQTLGTILSDGTGAIWSSETITVSAQNWIQVPGTIQGVDVPKIELLPCDSNGGVYCGASNQASPYYPYGYYLNGHADAIVNKGGTFSMGAHGTCTVDSYTQTAGTLKFHVLNFKGENSHLVLGSDSAATGGKLEIISYLQYVPDGTQSTSTKIISGPPAVLESLRGLVSFDGSFPDGITPSLAIFGSDMHLVLTVSP